MYLLTTQNHTEGLANVIRQDKKSIQIEKKEIFSLFADGMTVYVKNPEESMK